MSILTSFFKNNNNVISYISLNTLTLNLNTKINIIQLGTS
jgi:hypothetical protein